MFGYWIRLFIPAEFMILPTVFLVMTVSSVLFFPIYYGTAWALKHFSKANELTEKLKKKMGKYMVKWGYVGLALFVGLPGTSLVGSSLVAAGLKLPVKKAYLAILAGCCMEAGIVVGIFKGIGF